jgi:HAMP domain-containing protein
LDLQATLAERNHILLDILLFGQNEQMFAKYLKELEIYAETIENLFKEIIEDMMLAKITVQCIQSIDELQQQYENDEEHVTRLINTYRVNGKKAALTALKDFNYNQIIDSAIAELKEDNDRKFSIMLKKYNRGIIIAISFFGLALLLAIAIATQIGKHLVTNIIYLTNAADEISLGSLETPIHLKSNDELEELAQVFDRLRLDIKDAMDKLGKK